MNNAQRNVILLTAWFVLLAGPAQSANNLVYSDAVLKADQDRITQRANQLFETGLMDFLTATERASVAGIDLDLPLSRQSPLSASAKTFGGVPTLIMPISTLKFIEDLSLAYAWRYIHDYSLEPMDEYMGMLRYRNKAEFPNGVRPPPLTAMGVPLDVWKKDKRVDDLSLRFRNTAWAFVLAHELGHLRYKHEDTNQSPQQIQEQEEIADAFAIDLLGRTDTIPMGAILWFQASAVFTKNRSDFDSEAQYRNALDNDLKHPINAARLRSLAEIMGQQASQARDLDGADVLAYISGQLEGIAVILADPEMQLMIKRCSMERDLAELQRTQDRPC